MLKYAPTISIHGFNFQSIANEILYTAAANETPFLGNNP